MNRTLYIFIGALFLVTACTTSKKYLTHGNYEMAVRKSVQKLRKHPEKQKEIDVLREAYRNANQIDLDRISYLQTEGSPERWNEMFDRYNRLKSRQSQVATLQNYPKDAIGFKSVNYDDELAETKRKAAEYLYTHGKKLLDSGTKEEARQAWNEFNQIKGFYADYKDVNALLQQSKNAGMSYVLLSIDNKSQVILPQSYDQELRRISLSELNGPWINYHVKPTGDLKYDYKIQLLINNIDVSPEKEKEIQREEKARIKDGWKYKLDANGNVMKDSLGNDIKEDKYVNVHCMVLELLQSKAAIITGHLNFVETATGQLIKTEPFSVESVFENASAKFVGDKRALSKESQEKVQHHPVPFPNDGDMVLMTADAMKNKMKEIIWNSKGIFR